MSAALPLVPLPQPSLVPGEALVLWGLRLGAAHAANGPVIDQELTLAYGPLNGPRAASIAAAPSSLVERRTASNASIATDNASG